MYAYMFLMLFTVGVMSAASVGVLNVNNSTQSALKSAEDARILSLWEMTLGTSLEQAGTTGELAAPLGTNDTKRNIHTPPQWLTAPRTNAYGKPIIYCPVSRTTSLPAGIATSTVESNKKGYNVSISRWKNAHDYVVASDIKLDASIPRNNVLAFVISPLSDVTPSCQDVTYNAAKGRFYVGDKIASIRVITPASKINNGQPDVSDDDDSGVNISSLIEQWANTTGEDLTIAANGKDTFPTSVDSMKLDSANSIILKTKNGSIQKVLSASKNLKIQGVNFTFDGIDMSSLDSITFVNSKVLINNSILPKINLINSSLSTSGSSTLAGNLDSYGSKIFQSGSTLEISDQSRNVNLYNSQWNLINGATLSINSGKIPLNLMSDSTLSTTGSTVNLKASGSSTAEAIINNDSSSKISAYNSNINLTGKSTYGLYNQGLAHFESSNLTPTDSNQVVVYVTDGGRFHTDGSKIGNSAKKGYYGVIVDSSSFTSGKNSTIYSSYQCVSGSGYNGSKIMPDKITTNIQWTCR